MRGLRTQENEKFNRFWEIIQSKAASKGMMFLQIAVKVGNSF